MKRSISTPEVVRWKDKEFFSLSDFDYQDLLVILEDWQTDKVPSWEVSNFAEGLVGLEEGGWPDPPTDDLRFMLIEVSHLLEDLYGTYVFKEDIPALKEALHLGQTMPELALDKLNDYFDSIDFEARKKLIDNRFAQGLFWPP